MDAIVLVIFGVLLIMMIAAVVLTVHGIRRHNETPWAAGRTDYGRGGGCSGGSTCGGGSSCGGGSCGGGGGCGGGGD